MIGEGLKPVGMMRIALADKPEDEEETAVSAMAGETPEQTVLPGYENTKWGITAPDGSAVTDHTWEKHFEMVRESAKNGIRVRINGIDVDFPDQKPLMEQGRVLVPMRPVFEHVCVQCRVSWDGEAGVATVYDQKGRQVTFKPGELSYTVTNADGSVRLYPLDVPAAVVGGRVLLPLRALLETFSYKVDWYETHQRVDIQDSFPGWRKLMKPDEWKRALEEECLPCSLVREVS
ncbi:MAG: copper amine oxidase N-terminal domain-containing protein [Clostridiales bacterium]|nr:copper amine oxidase N-terminal domain-containing protein [Clostridiales bacterium]